MFSRTVAIASVGACLAAAAVFGGAGGAVASPEKALLKLQEATAAMMRGRFDQAVGLYDEVLADASVPKTRHASIYNDRGVAKWRQQQLEEALGDFGQAIGASPDYAPAYNNRGTVLMELERVDEAYTDFDKALSLSPGFAAAYNNRGNANHELGRYDAAAEDFRKAVELMPSTAVPFNGRGKTQAALGRSYTALRYLNRAITLNGQYTAAYENRARVFAHLGRHDDAIDDLDKVINVAPERADLHILHGQASAELRRSQQALRDFGKALELEPENAEALVGRGIQNVERKRFDLAIEDLTQALTIDAEMPDAYYYRAQAHWQQDAVDAARPDVEKALSLDPKYQEAYVLKAEMAEKAGDAQGAIDNYRKALELDPFSDDARKGFEKASGETVASVVRPLAEPVSGWAVYSPAPGRFVAVNDRYPKINLLLEMHGEGTAAIVEWTPLKDWLSSIGLLRYKAGTKDGKDFEYVAIVDLGGNKVVAIEPYVWGDHRSKWDWTQNTVTVTDPEGLASFYELRKPKPVAQPRVRENDREWGFFDEPRGGGGYRAPRGPNLFDWLFR